MEATQAKQQKRTRRHARVRAKVSGTAARPRLAVHRSNKALRAQLIDDTAGTTLAAATSQSMTGTPGERAVAVGTAIGELAKSKKIEQVVFDRGGFLYAGSIKVLADAAREAGLVF